MNKLRILHTESSCGWGGQEIRILSEAAGMIKRGHHVTILTCPTAALYQAALERKIPVVALPIEKKSLSALFALARWLYKHRDAFDVINTHSSTDSWLLALARLFVINKSIPIIRTRHISAKVGKDFTTRWLYLNATKHIVTTGEKLRQDLCGHNNFPLERMTSVPTGIDLNYFIPQEKNLARAKLHLSERPILGILAVLRSWKGHHYLFEAWEKLQPQLDNWQLLIVGDGPMRGKLEADVNSRAWRHSVVFAGNQHNVVDWLNAMDVFVLPSYANEGVPQSIMQAMACQLPIVSTTIGAIPEIIIPDETGILVPPKDTKALVGMLEQLMSDPKLQQKLGQNARQYALRNFSDETMLDKMEHIFRREIYSADKREFEFKV